MPHLHPQVMQATGNEHDPVSEAGFRIAEAFFDDADAFDAREDMFNDDPELPDHAVVLPLRIRPVVPWLFLDRLIDHDGIGRKALKGTILIQLTVGGKQERGALRQGFIVHRAGGGGAQEADFARSKVGDDHIFIRVRFFLPL